MADSTQTDQSSTQTNTTTPDTTTAPTSPAPIQTNSGGLAGWISDGLVKAATAINPITAPASTALALGTMAALHPDAQTQQNTNSSVIPTAAPQFEEGNQQAYDNLGATASEAGQGLTRAAQTTKDIVSPSAAQGQSAATGAVQSNDTTIETARQNYIDSVNYAHGATINAESALNNAAAKATIDPVNYISNLGVDKSLMAAAGMMLSGIGSGLTGQPNIAMDIFQKNIDRNIAAQQQSFNNLASIAAKSQGLVGTAQQQQNIAATTHAAASMSVYTGVNSLINAATQNANAQISPDMVASLKNEIALKTAAAKQNFTQSYIQLHNTGDTKSINAYGQVMQGVGKSLSKGPALTPSDFILPSPVNQPQPSVSGFYGKVGSQ